MLAKNILSVCTPLGLITTGIILLLVRVWIFDLIVSLVIVLGPNSIVLNFWKTSPDTMTTSYYFFNWTNPEEIHNISSKPKFEEVGPYIFKEIKEKVNLTWNDNNTVTFQMLQRWYFDEEKSQKKLTDQITTINAVTVSGSYKLRYRSYFLKKLFALSLGPIAPQLDVTKSVEELLHGGYEEPYIEIVKMIPALQEFVPPTDKFGWMYSRNNSYTSLGIFNMADGVEAGTGEVLQWNYQKKTPYFKDTCAKLKGSTGEFYPQRRTRDYVDVFIPDMCRNFKFGYEKDIDFKNIQGYMYSIQNSMLDNGTLVPENKCSCDGECIPSGMVNITSCAFGAPTFISLPHFYGADLSYVKAVEGMRPEKSKHESYLFMEPRMGLTMQATARFQVNILLEQSDDIWLFNDLPRIFIPVLWIEQKATVQDSLAWLLWLLQKLPTIIIPVISAILIIIGICLLASKNQEIIKLFAEKTIFRPRYISIPRNNRNSTICRNNVCDDII